MRVLLVQDDPGDTRLIRGMLDENTQGEFELTHVSSMQEAETHLGESVVDIILLDLGLRDAQGLGHWTCAPVAPRVAIVVLNAHR